MAAKVKITRFEDDGELEKMYREVVEEKKGTYFSFVLCAQDLILLFAALEALIVTLHTHLARLTSELSSHQQLLSELRILRERDSRTLRGRRWEKGGQYEQGRI